jgi:hypothetical protein
MTTNHHYGTFCKEFYTQKIKTNQTTREWEVSNHRRRKNKQLRVALNWLHTNKSSNNRTNGKNHHIPT